MTPQAKTSELCVGVPPEECSGDQYGYVPTYPGRPSMPAGTQGGEAPWRKEKSKSIKALKAPVFESTRMLAGFRSQTTNP